MTTTPDDPTLGGLLGPRPPTTPAATATQAYEPCGRCGSTEREQHMREVICAGCRTVTEYREPQPRLIMDLPDESASDDQGDAR